MCIPAVAEHCPSILCIVLCKLGLHLLGTVCLHTLSALFIRLPFAAAAALPEDHSCRVIDKSSASCTASACVCTAIAQSSCCTACWVVCTARQYAGNHRRSCGVAGCTAGMQAVMEISRAHPVAAGPGCGVVPYALCACPGGAAQRTMSPLCVPVAYMQCKQLPLMCEQKRGFCCRCSFCANSCTESPAVMQLWLWRGAGRTLTAIVVGSE
jgi:hypothetical protein